MTRYRITVKEIIFNKGIKDEEIKDNTLEVGSIFADDCQQDDINFGKTLIRISAKVIVGIK